MHLEAMSLFEEEMMELCTSKIYISDEERQHVQCDGVR